MIKEIDTLIIGAGQSGLALSYYLGKQGRPHIILEKQCIGASWRNKCWDSFCLVTPNWMLNLPGMEYKGQHPDGFLKKEEIINYLEDYAKLIHAPIKFNAEVKSITYNNEYLVQTSDEIFKAKNVVVTTSIFHQPKIPSFASKIANSIKQLHASQYREPQHIAAGNVLVVGSGQSGCQIAEELAASGKKVYLCVSRTARIPRTYRGKDITFWLAHMDRFDTKVESLPSPAARFAAHAHLTGVNGGHTIHLQDFNNRGIVLLGYLQDANNKELSLIDNLAENMKYADEAEFKLLSDIDNYIKTNNLIDINKVINQEEYTKEIISSPTKIDLAQENIKTIIWATGYKIDFSWIKLNIFDQYGYPLQKRGITEYPGLYFLGLHWLHTAKSGLFYGVGEDAKYIASII